ncbi:hypothetical protein Agub_g15276, partial [Astrephomene gubernaculifera]
MCGSLQQLRLTSGRECSTSYSHCYRPFPTSLRRSSRRGRSNQRGGLAISSSNDAAALYPSNDDGMAGSSKPDVEAPVVESISTAHSEQPKDQPTDGLPKVPWGLGKVFQVMALWLLAYILIGQVAVPLVLSLLGLDRPELSVRSHAVLHLCLDISQLLLTLGILWSCLKDYQPRKLGLFPVRLRGRWILAVALCCATFPAVDWLAHQSMGWFPSELDATWASNLEHSLSIGDWVTNVAYFSVVSLCAPIWEEAIFRGFLMTSLARYMPTPYAVAASSVVFAMCHFRMQTFLPLLVLGVVFSLVFIRTNNLIPPVLLH